MNWRKGEKNIVHRSIYFKEGIKFIKTKSELMKNLWILNEMYQIKARNDNTIVFMEPRL